MPKCTWKHQKCLFRKIHTVCSELQLKPLRYFSSVICSENPVAQNPADGPAPAFPILLILLLNNLHLLCIPPSPVILILTGNISPLDIAFFRNKFRKKIVSVAVRWARPEAMMLNIHACGGALGMSLA